jgi:uncharacterized protein (UPF0248 family)
MRNNMNPRDVLNKIKWDKNYDFNFIQIWYIHRGVPNNTKIITGKDVLEIQKTFIKTVSAMIPMHRIFKIKYNEITLFER